MDVTICHLMHDVMCVTCDVKETLILTLFPYFCFKARIDGTHCKLPLLKKNVLKMNDQHFPSIIISLYGYKN